MSFLFEKTELGDFTFQHPTKNFYETSERNVLKTNLVETFLRREVLKEFFLRNETVGRKLGDGTITSAQV